MTNTSSINGLSANFIHSMLADQLTNGSLTKSSSKNSASGDSPFSKMLSDATSGSSVASSGNPRQLLSQLVSNYQVGGVQSQGQSLDPMLIAA